MSLKRYHTELWRGFEQEDFELLRRSLSVLERFPIQRTRQALERWKNYLILLEVERKRIRDETRAKEVMAVISNSKRLERTFHEKETIRKYLHTYAPCIPIKKMDEEDINVLCNEIDIVKTSERCLIFLQGDFGNRYYLVTRGQVGLYAIDSNDGVVSNARKYGDHRNLKFPGTEDELAELGERVAVLQGGVGFGELSILSSTHKLRTASAVGMTDEDLVFMMYEKTYNEVLRKYHFRQQELAETITYLGDIPLCESFNFSALAQVAYNMKSINYAKKTLVISAGDDIDSVYLVREGEIKVSLSTDTGNDKVIGSFKNKVPEMYVSLLCRGMVLGESDIRVGKSKYTSNFTTVTDCSVYEMPMKIYQNCVRTYDKNRAKSLKENAHFNEKVHLVGPNILKHHADLKSRNDERAARAAKDVTKYVISHKVNNGLKEELKEILPSILDVQATVKTAVSTKDHVNENVNSRYEERPLSAVNATQIGAASESMMNHLKSIGRNEYTDTQSVKSHSPRTACIPSKSAGKVQRNANRRGKHLKFNESLIQKR